MTRHTRAYRQRSKSGCWECRRRHIKCDEAKPVCNNCAKSNRVCERGSRLNFFKCSVVNPLRGVTKQELEDAEFVVDLSQVRYLDQSFTIHKHYKYNKFHDYSKWSANHSEQELNHSDADFQKSMEIVSNDAVTQNSATKNKLKVISVVELNDNSDSDTSRHSVSPIMEFDLNDFISKVISYPPPSGQQTLLVHFDLSKTLESYGLKVPQKKINNEVTLLDFAQFIENLETGFDLSSFEQQTRFEADFEIFCTSIALCVKTGRVDPFNDSSYAAQKIITYLNSMLSFDKVHNVESFRVFDRLHNFVNLMNFYELLLLDLNESLRYNKANCILMYSDKTEFLMEKFSHLNLNDHLNYFMVQITTILLKLNCLKYHGQSKNIPMELLSLIKSLKEFETNQFLMMYLPTVSDHGSSPRAATSSSSSNSSFSATLPQASLEPPLSHQATPPRLAASRSKLDYGNIQMRRLHAYYNFTIAFILHNFRLNEELRNYLFLPNQFSSFWREYESDPFLRLRASLSDYDFTNDSFMSFLNRFK